jgi:molecular chaperone DnaJ
MIASRHVLFKAEPHMKKDYYKILKIDHDVDEKGIRAAYRKLAKVHHPDRAGQQATAAFQDIAEAYRVLSDLEKRRCYDELLFCERKRSCFDHIDKTEPLTPFRSERIHPGKPSFDDVFESVWAGNARPEKQLPEHYDAEVLLTQEEAEHGCLLNFTITVPNACYACRGAGTSIPLRCRHCHGTGSTKEDLYFRIRIPPMVGNGTAFELPIRVGSISRLRIHLFIK